MNTDILAEQIEYYRQRASEYDEWFLRQGRYDRGEKHRQQWFSNDGRTYRVVKIFHEPLQLEKSLQNLDWSGSVNYTANYFLYSLVYPAIAA